MAQFPAQLRLQYANEPVGDDYCRFAAAIRRSNAEAVTALLDTGADANVQNIKGYTPLMEATRHRDRDIVRLLLSRNADVNIQNCDGNTALTIAARQSYLDVVVEILSVNKADINLANARGSTALMEATKTDSFKVFLLLLNAHAKLDAQNCEGNTALIIATKMCYEQKINMLLVRGADVNIPRLDGDTALIIAARRCSETAVHSILAYGADIDRQNLRGDTALMEATRRSAIRILSELLSMNADVNIQNLNGDTALINAAGAGDEKTTKFLLSNGADVDLQTNAGHDALSTAILELASSRKRRDRTIQEDHGMLNVVATLLDSGALPDTDVLHVLASRGMLETMHGLILLGFGPLDVDTSTSYFRRDPQICLKLPKMSPFLAALLFGQSDVAEYLSGLNFFTETDMKLFRNKKETQNLRNLLQERRQMTTKSLLGALLSKPWSLFRLCFVQLSLNLGGDLGRRHRVEDEIPSLGRLQEKLCFEEVLGRGL